MTARFEEPSVTAAGLSRTHRFMRVQPSHDATLGYRILIPKGWATATRIDKAPADIGRAELIGLFCPPQTERTRISVGATRLPWEVDPLGWTAARWSLMGWRVTHRRWLDAHRFEVGASFGEGIDAQVRRGTGMVVEGKLVRVDVEAPLVGWEELHDLLWPAGALFVLEGRGRDQFEARGKHEGPWLRFALPWSWTVEGGPRGDTDGASWVAWPEDDGVQSGLMLRVDVGPTGRDPQVRLQRLLRDLALREVVLTEPLSEVTMARPGVGVERHLRARARYQADRLDVAIAQRTVEPAVDLDVLMLAPDPTKFHLDWLRAQRAFEIAVQTAQGEPTP